MAKVQAQRYRTPVSRYSMRHKTPFTGTGLLTSDEIDQSKGIDQEIRRRMRGFRSNTSDAAEMLATSDIDPTDVALHEAVTPQPSKRQWIQTMSPLDRDYMLRYVSCAIALQGGMTTVTRRMISDSISHRPSIGRCNRKLGHVPRG